MKYDFLLEQTPKSQNYQNIAGEEGNDYYLNTQAEEKQKQYHFNDLFLNKNHSDQEENPFNFFSDEESINFHKSYDFDSIQPQKQVYENQEQENIEKKVKENTQQVKTPKKPLKQIPEEISCKCQSSNCLRLHCSCFKTLGFCSDTCRCTDCLNKKEFKQARQFVIQKTKKIYKKAFEEKCYEIRGMKINKQGCNCKRSCQSQYCGCRKINGQCSPICRCVECSNNKVSLTKDEIQDFYKPCSRKKDKIIINFKKNIKAKNIVIDKNIIYQTYQKGKV